jgi:hypothetical protein
MEILNYVSQTKGKELFLKFNTSCRIKYYNTKRLTRLLQTPQMDGQ